MNHPRRNFDLRIQFTWSFHLLIIRINFCSFLIIIFWIRLHFLGHFGLFKNYYMLFRQVLVPICYMLYGILYVCMYYLTAFVFWLYSLLTVFFLFPLFLFLLFSPQWRHFKPTLVDILVKTTYFRSRPIGRHDPPGICRLHGLTCFFFDSGLEVDNVHADRVGGSKIPSGQLSRRGISLKISAASQ